MIVNFPIRQFNTLPASQNDLALARIEARAFNEAIYHALHHQDEDTVDHLCGRREAALERIRKASEWVDLLALWRRPGMNELRDVFHRILAERGLSHIGISSHQYAMLDAMEELVMKRMERLVKGMAKLERDDGS